MSNKTTVLLTSVFIIAICGILYELLISTISSYFQGSSILHFSIVIGLFLSFMGVGSFLSKYIKEDLLTWFIRFEILLSIVGGFSALLLYFAFSLTPYFYGVTFVIIAILGALIGIEIPILARIVRKYETLKDTLANVLSFDYLGSLVASVAFPLLLLPVLGTMKTAFAIGFLNLLVAISNTWSFKKDIKNAKLMLATESLVGALLISGFIFSFQINSFFETFLYRDEVVYSKQTPYQHLVMTRWNQDTRLFIDGNLQFSSLDEYRYHESLVHVPMTTKTHHERILVLGGGDGMVAREILKYGDVDSITVVDLDPAITELAKRNPTLLRLNEKAFLNKKVKIYNEDAYKFIEKNSNIYDVIIIDLPDPNNTSLGKLYSHEFYRLIQKRLAVGGVVVTQSTSPYYASNAFWCIHNTMKTVFENNTYAYQTYVPSFGQWGFNMGVNIKGRMNTTTVATAYTKLDSIVQKRLFQENDLKLRYLNPTIINGLFQFDEDTKHRETEINKLNNQVLLQYYEKSWEQY